MYCSSVIGREKVRGRWRHRRPTCRKIIAEPRGKCRVIRRSDHRISCRSRTKWSLNHYIYPSTPHAGSLLTPPWPSRRSPSRSISAQYRSFLPLTPSRYRQRSVTPRTNLSNDATSVIAIAQLVPDRIPSLDHHREFLQRPPLRSSAPAVHLLLVSVPPDFSQSSPSPVFSSRFSSFPSFPLLRFESMLVPLTVKIMKTTRRVGSSASKRRRKHDSRWRELRHAACLLWQSGAV